MVDKVQVSALVVEAIFLLTGCLMLGVTVSTQSEMSKAPTVKTVGRHLLLSAVPLSGVIANAIFVFITFGLSIPTFAFPRKRVWLQIHAWLIVFCAAFSLILGLDIWYRTLKTRTNLSELWGKESPSSQSLLQQEFNCCGYLDGATPPFQRDATCPNVLVAAQKLGCVGRFSSFANSLLDAIFTAIFGVVALDFILLLCIAMVQKKRKQQQRYRMIEKKSGFSGI